MSLFKYFAPVTNNSTNICRRASDVAGTLSNNPSTSGISQREIILVQEELNNISTDQPTKRNKYSEQEKVRVGRYAAENSVMASITKFKNEFPKLTPSTVRPWMNKYKLTLLDPTATIGAKRGRPLYLSSELDQKLRAMIINLRTAGAEINKHVVKGILAGLIRSNMVRYGQFLDFQVSRTWVRSLYQRMRLSRRVSTTSRPIITRSIWEESKERYLSEIASKVSDHNIPDELIFNADQTPSKYVAASKVTMAETNKKNIPIKGASDKRAITLTVIQSLSGDILPLQIIYTGKTKRCLPKNASKNKHKFLFSFNKSHWSNEKETLRLINDILDPYINEVKEKLGLPQDKKCLLIWDAFTGQNTARVKERLEELGIITVQVPKNLTHLLQPLDITTNGKIKKLEKAAFGQYLTKVIMDALLEDPCRDVTTIDIDLKLSTLKPKHLDTLTNIFKFFKSEDGKSIILSGFRFAGITDIVAKAREGVVLSLDPYAN